MSRWENLGPLDGRGDFSIGLSENGSFFAVDNSSGSLENLLIVLRFLVKVGGNSMPVARNRSIHRFEYGPLVSEREELRPDRR